MSEQRVGYAKPIFAPGRKSRPVGFPEKMDAADFIGFMCQQFRVYHKEGSAEEAQWTDAMIAVLSVYPEEVLADGCLWFWQNRKEVRFPLSAEIITVCDEINKNRVRPTLLREETEKARSDPWSKERADLTRHLLRAGPLGLQAVRENWIGALGDYIRRHGRLPEAAEVPRIKRISSEVTEDLERVYRMPGAEDGGSLVSAMKRAAQSIERRRREYAAMVTGETNV